MSRARSLPIAQSPSRGRKALIKVGYGCNEHCTFCHTADVRHIEGTSEEVVRKIHRAHELDFGMTVLSGGEPTIRPELLSWASLIAELGMDFGLVTNGLVFAYPEWIDRLVQKRLRYVYMSLHGIGRIHNRLVRAESWENAFAAIKNLSGRGLELTVNCVVTKQNVEHLLPLADALLPFTDVRLKFSMTQPKGGGERLFDAITERVSVVASRVHEAIAHGTAKVAASGAAGPRFGHDGIPHCLLPGQESLYDDLKTHRYAVMSDIGEPDFFPIDEALNVQPESICGDCSLRGACPGLFRGYAERFDMSEIKAPPPAPRSNSFTWTFESLIASDAEETHCPLRDGTLGITPWDKHREFFVRNRTPSGYRIARFRTDTRDFAEVELGRIKHTLGQAYLDISQKPAPNDFARDLRPLERSSLCRGCEHRERCTGLYEVRLEDDPFTRDDARVQALIASLEGDVLDLGCGDGPYESILSERANEGRIRYVGVDPHAPLEALQARWPWATLLKGDAESVVLDRRFQHVLLLRSWNHLREPEKAIARMVECLLPQGELLLVDNVAFGLLRTRTQTQTAVQSDSIFEHYRNDDAERAHQTVLRAAPGKLSLLERMDVGPGTANQWLLRYRRTP